MEKIWDGCSKRYGSAHYVGIEGVGYGTTELLAEVVCIKLLKVYYGSIILAREPTLALASIGFADVTGVATRSILQCAVKDRRCF